MGTPCTPPNAKLICGILTADDDLLTEARRRLDRIFGPVDITDGPWPFDTTDYYTDEMGIGLRRWFVAFSQLVPPDRLAEIKHATNRIESDLADHHRTPTRRRPVNLDPGYVALEKLVLATTKNHAHRIYIGDRMYGEVTLRYTDGRWQPWPWTFPDYARETYHPFLTRARDALHAQLNTVGAEERDPCPS
jgi:hypothetical protein